MKYYEFEHEVLKYEILKTPVNISVRWKRICWHLDSFSCYVTEVRFEQTERIDRALWKEDFSTDMWKNLNGKKTYLRRKMRVVDDEKSCILYFHFLIWAITFWVLAFGYVLRSAVFIAEAFLRSITKLRCCGLASVCTLILRWTQNKPIRLMVLWC
jgi:hypothetical protein